MITCKCFLEFIGGIRMKFFQKRMKQFISLICALAVLTPCNLSVSANAAISSIGQTITSFTDHMPSHMGQVY